MSQEKPAKGVHLSLVRESLEQAEPAPEPPAANVNAPGESEAGATGATGATGAAGAAVTTRQAPPPVEPSEPGLPDDCPVIPLGVLNDEYFYIDTNRQLRRITWQQHRKQLVVSLFGLKACMIESIWPRKSAKGAVIGWDGEAAIMDLIGACSKRGIWNPTERERGAGAWLGEDGELILHCGAEIRKGERIFYYPNGKKAYGQHCRCGEDRSREFEAVRFDEDMY